MSNNNEKVNNALETIKAFFSKEKTPAEVQLKVAFTLADGTNVEAEAADGQEELKSIDNLVKGSSINVQTAEGLKPMADGEHELENGDVVTTVDGVVTEILKKETVEEVAEKANESTDTAEEQIAAMEAEIARLKSELEVSLSKVTELSATNETLTTKVTDLEGEVKLSKEKLEESNSHLKLAKEALEAVETAPVEEPTKKPITATVEMSATDRAIQMGMAARSLKSNTNKIITTK